MDAKYRGQLQALLSSVKAHNVNKTSVSAEKLVTELTEFSLILKNHLKSSTKVAEELALSSTKVEKLENLLSETKTDLITERNQAQHLQLELGKLRAVQGELVQVKSSLSLAESQVETCKVDVEQMSERVQARDGEIKTLNSKLAEKDCTINKLHTTIKLNMENVGSLEEELKAEKENSASLSKQIEDIKCAHREELDNLKLEMGEKVMKAQARIAAQQSAHSLAGLSSDSSSLDYKEIFKKKMAHMESRHTKEVSDLKRTISRLQQQSGHF